MRYFSQLWAVSSLSLFSWQESWLKSTFSITTRTGFTVPSDTLRPGISSKDEEKRFSSIGTKNWKRPERGDCKKEKTKLRHNCTKSDPQLMQTSGGHLATPEWQLLWWSVWKVWRTPNNDYWTSDSAETMNLETYPQRIVKPIIELEKTSDLAPSYIK